MRAQCIRIMCHGAKICTYDVSYQVTQYHVLYTPPSIWPPCSCILHNIAHAAHQLPRKLAPSLYSGQTSWHKSVDAVSGLSHLLFLHYSSPQISTLLAYSSYIVIQTGILSLFLQCPPPLLHARSIMHSQKIAALYMVRKSMQKVHP